MYMVLSMYISMVIQDHIHSMRVIIILESDSPSLRASDSAAGRCAGWTFSFPLPLTFFFICNLINFINDWTSIESRI